MCLSLQSLRCGGNGGVLPDRLDPNKHDRSIWAIVGTERRPNQMGWPGILCARDAGRSVAGGAALAGVHVGARTCCLAQRNQKTRGSVSCLWGTFAQSGTARRHSAQRQRRPRPEGQPSAPPWSAYQASAALTRAGDIGKARRRLPVSRATALAMAGATGPTPASPIPVGGASDFTIRVWISGMSAMRRTG